MSYRAVDDYDDEATEERRGLVGNSLSEKDGSGKPLPGGLSIGKYRSSILCINLVNVVQWTAMMMVSTVYGGLQEDFALSSVLLAAIGPTRAVILYLISPVYGYLADTRQRTPVYIIGMLIWGVSTAMMAQATSYHAFLGFLIVSAFGMGVITPLTYSFLADYSETDGLGSSIGWLGFSSVIGGLLGVVIPTALTNVTVHGISGWRLTFTGAAVCILLMALITFAMLFEPKRKSHVPMSSRHLTSLLENPTFILVVFQGFFGSLSWDVIYFLIVWYQCMGMSPWESALIFGVCCAGAAVGGLSGGYVGDYSSRASPRRGRLLVSQGSVFIGLPLGAIFFAYVTPAETSLWIYVGLGFIFGYSISWPAAACIIPIINEVVPNSIIGTAFAIDRMVEGGSTAIGSMSVGFLAQHFGYMGKDYCDVAKRGLAVTQQQAGYLGKALSLVMIIPWSLYFLIFFVLYFTYPRDRARKALMEKEDDEQARLAQGTQPTSQDDVMVVTDNPFLDAMK